LEEGHELVSATLETPVAGCHARRIWAGMAGTLISAFYMHYNPVRHRLCEKAEDWQYSEAAEYASLGLGPLKMDRESLATMLSG
jgi:hypothetical protein